MADQFSGYLMRKLYFTQQTGRNAGLNYALYNCEADIMILGDSRAQHHYDTRILSDSVHLSCYNAGIDGSSIFLPYSIIKIALKRYTPKIIIIEFGPSSLNYIAQDYEKLSILLPYYKICPELKSLVLKKSPWERIKLISSIYPFNSLILNILRFNTSLDAKRKWEINGYIPIKDRQMNKAMIKPETVTSDLPQIDPNKITVLQEIIKICKSRKIELYFINSPIFRSKPAPMLKISELTKQEIDTLKKMKANYIDYSDEPHFIGQMQFFADPIHLNEKGATLYSKLIGELLKKANLPTQ